MLAPDLMRLLLLDTCGDTGSLALAEGGRVLRERTLGPRAASAHLMGAIRAEMEALAWPLQTLRAVGVVNGPGSFTGVRVGLAAAKGLCEVAGLDLVTVSRLEVLLGAGHSTAEAVAVLDAGRGEFYVRSAASADELLMTREELVPRATGRHVLVAEEKVLLSLEELNPFLIDLSAAHALTLTSGRLLHGESDSVEVADANYVRSARALYAAGRNTPAAPESS